MGNQCSNSNIIDCGTQVASDSRNCVIQVGCSILCLKDCGAQCEINEQDKAEIQLSKTGKNMVCQKVRVQRPTD